MDLGVTDRARNSYDTLIQNETTRYDLKFSDSPGYKTVNYQIFGALLRLESRSPCHPNKAWTTRLLKIGNTQVVRNGKPLLARDHELHPCDRFQPTNVSGQCRITGWLDCTSNSIQHGYNYTVNNSTTSGRIKDDPAYAEKLRFVLGLFQKLKR